MKLFVWRTTTLVWFKLKFWFYPHFFYLLNTVVQFKIEFYLVLTWLTCARLAAQNGVMELLDFERIITVFWDRWATLILQPATPILQIGNSYTAIGNSYTANRQLLYCTTWLFWGVSATFILQLATSILQIFLRWFS